MNFFFIIIIAFFISNNTSAQTKINGVLLPDKLKIDNQELKFNGGGVRKKMFFKVYVIGLYLEQKNSEAKAIIESEDFMAIRIQITSSVVSSSNMSDAIMEGFERSMQGNIKSLENEIHQFITYFKQDEIKEGHIFELHYKKGVGVISYKNGVKLGVIPGNAFKQALLGIWLSAHAIDNTLKDNLLGKN